MMRMKRIIEPLVHFLIWMSGFILVLMFVKTLGPFKKVDNTLLLPVINGTVINLILFYTVSLYFIPRYSRLKRTWVFLLSTIMFFLALGLLETYLDNKFFIYYYSDTKEPFSSQFAVNSVLNFLILTSSLGYGFVKVWFRNEQTKKLLEQDKLRAELNFLKAQLNPHFLFNVLNIAFSSASCNGDDKTANIIGKISGLMRYMIYDSNVERVDLATEVEYLQNYILLQKMRFSEDMPVEVEFKVSGDHSGVTIAPLILITFIENAFKFGVKLGSKSKIEISISVEDDLFIFKVRNPVFNTNDGERAKNSGIGLVNTRERLSLLYPASHTLNIINEGDYFIITLVLAI